MPMKIAFSTVGCPEWSWNEIYPMAKDLGYHGIEVRGIGSELSAINLPPFSADELPRTCEKLKSLNLEISCFSSAVALKNPQNREQALTDLFGYIGLAAKIGTKYVRVLADSDPQPDGNPVDDNYVYDMLTRLEAYASYKKVILLVESNGVYADTQRLRKLLDRVNSPSVAALWDINHPFRFFNELPETTISNLGKHLRYIHFKDSVRTADGEIEYRMTGEGDFPIRETFKILEANGYDGYISLEWVKRWAAHLQAPSVVFPHFASYMQNYFAESAAESSASIQSKTRLFEKDLLIDYTFGQLLERVAAEFPDQCAFDYTTRDYTRTYREFLDEVDMVARSLIAMGVRKGDHVAIWATNYPEWFLTFWAATRIGAVLVTVNTAYKIHEAEYLLRQSDTHTLILIDGYKESHYLEILNELCPELKDSPKGELHAKKLPRLRNVITIESKSPGCFSWDELPQLAERVPQSVIEEISKTLDKDDVCNMQYTSGTTGFPKGVMLTHYNVVNNGKCIGDCMDFTTDDSLLIQVPMFHCFGMVLAMTAAVTHGTTMVPIEYFQPVKALEAIRKRKITAMHGVPTMFIAILEHPDFHITDFSNLRTGIMAGSPCPVPVMEAVVEKLNMSDITIVFGQTESSPGCTQSRVGDPLDVRVETVGSPLPGVECRIVDPETNLPLPDNTPGEFVARGYNIMKGYYNMPEATAAAIDKDGWLHTGDIAVRTPDGNYKITGRIKDMIIRGGENIYPKEIEEFLYTHPAVKDVQVIGVPDKVYGEEIMACVIKKENAEVTEDELKSYVRSRMAKHKTPRYIRFVDSFPMNAAGKILKYQMREWATEQLNAQLLP